MMLARTAIVWLALAPAASEPVAPAEPPAPTTSPTPEPAEAVADDVLTIDEILPCGLRIVAAQDKTLPVAAIVLAVETGTEDDPTDQPGRCVAGLSRWCHSRIRHL